MQKRSPHPIGGLQAITAFRERARFAVPVSTLCAGHPSKGACSTRIGRQPPCSRRGRGHHP